MNNPGQHEKMINPKKYGNPPFCTVIVHGGPGAGGEMSPVAQELASRQGVLEPIQTKSSISGQVEELKSFLEEDGDLPVTLVGFSWGAWLGCILAAQYPELIKKLVLVGSGPFEEKYIPQIQKTRLSRLSEAEVAEVNNLLIVIDNPAIDDKRSVFTRFGEIFSKADAYNPIGQQADSLEFRADIFQNVWKEAAELRRSGRLLELSASIQCPVVAIHGAADPHPAEGVQQPLSTALTNFRFILLEKCGHKPWIEREAAEKFYHLLKREIKQAQTSPF
ncbi:MAG: alpha/beta fold hydrolase [Methanosarcinaceae archaeon]